MSQQEVQQIQISIDQARAMIAKGEAVQRLEQIPDFQTIIGKGYFEAEAIRLVHAKSNQQMQEPHIQQMLEFDIRAIGSLADYLRILKMQASHAAQQLQAHNDEIDRARNPESYGDLPDGEDESDERLTGGAADMNSARHDGEPVQ